MGMNAGSASVSGGTIVGTGIAFDMAVAMATAMESSAAAALVAAGLVGVSTTLPTSSVTALRQQACDMANAVALMVGHIQINAVVHISAPVEAQIVAGTPVDLAVQ